MQRLNRDRGAVAVFVALMMVPLLLSSALVVDLGSARAKKQALQRTADAVALAIAQDCAVGACGNAAATAATLTAANSGSLAATSTSAVNGNTVEVSSSAVVDYAFAPVVGIDNTTVTAQSSATWSYPSGGTAVLPLVFSWCAFAAQTGGGIPSSTAETTLYLPKTDATECTSKSGNPVPGGFAWLKTNSGTCGVTSATAPTAKSYSDPGRSTPTGCNEVDFIAQQDKVVLLPVYDQLGGTGSGAWYHIYGYAAFHLTGYNITGQYKWQAPCTGNDSCIRGYFTQYVPSTDTFTSSATAPDLGARFVYLSS